MYTNAARIIPIVEALIGRGAVLGTWCSNCQATLKVIEAAAASKAEAIHLEKVEDLPAIMSTPGVVIDGTVVHAGGIPPHTKVESWF